MSQVGFTPIQIYRSSTAATLPVAGNLAPGELAINTTDEKLYFENTGGTVTLLASSAATGGTFTTVTATTVVNGLGAVGTPSYTFTGDLNTGMWSPAADTVAVSTAGAERLRISSTGLVGIGTTTPSARLTVIPTSVPTSATGTLQTAIGEDTNTTNYQMRMGYILDTTYKSVINSIAAGNGADLLLNPSGGNVGIGTTTPDARLTVEGSYGLLTVKSTTGSKRVALGSDAFTDAFVGTSTAHNFSVIAAGSINTTFTTGGNVGIGTTAPGAKLSVVGTAKIGEGAAVNTSKLLVNTLSGVAPGIQLFQDGNESWIIQNPASTTALTFSNSGTERMRLTGTGDLGIGNTPGVKLDVTGSAIRVSNTTGYNSSSAVRFDIGASNDSSVNNSATYQWSMNTAGDANGQSLLFSAYRRADTTLERMVITSAGNVGIGLSAPTSKLEIYGGAAGTATFATIGNATTAALFGVGTGNDVQIRTAQAVSINFYTSATQRMTLDSAGQLGVSATPSAWGASFKAIQMQNGTSLSSHPSVPIAYLNSNSYYDGTVSRYVVNGYASTFIGDGNSGGFTWQTAPTGTAGNVITTTTRMRLDGIGNLFVGMAGSLFSNVVRLEVLAPANNHGTMSTVPTAAFQAYIAHNSATAGDNNFMAFGTEAAYTGRGGISYNRAAGLVSYNTTSDYRAKEVFGPVENPGDTIDSLKVYTGKMLDATQSRPMLIAHEAQAVAPYAVTGEKDAVNEDGTPHYQQMDTSALVPLLIAEVQSLRARVAQLEGK